jgi:membrane protease YdiL (CAAX protease family)
MDKNLKNSKDSALKQAELASALGAGIIGFGLGVYLADCFKPYALWIVVIGIALHGIAMYKKASIKPTQLRWANWLYWLCWAIIIDLAIYILASIILSLQG